MREQLGYVLGELRACAWSIAALALFVAGIASVVSTPGNVYCEHETAVTWANGHTGRNASLLLAASVVIGALGIRFDEAKPLAFSCVAVAAVFLLSLLCRIDFPWLAIDYVVRLYVFY